jgi:predicted aspartyl protease
MTGRVADGREALILLDLLGLGESRARIEAVVDTGFTGHLSSRPR